MLQVHGDAHRQLPGGQMRGHEFGAGPFKQPAEKRGAEDVGDSLEKLLGRMFRAGLEPLLIFMPTSIAIEPPLDSMSVARVPSSQWSVVNTLTGSKPFKTKNQKLKTATGYWLLTTDYCFQTASGSILMGPNCSPWARRRPSSRACSRVSGWAWMAPFSSAPRTRISAA